MRVSGPLVLSALMLLLTACSENVDKPTMTRDQAQLKAEAYLAGVAGDLPSGIAHAPSQVDDADCYSNGHHDADGRVEVVVSFTLSGAPDTRTPEVYEAFRRHMAAKGFKVAGDQGPRRMTFKNSSDGFTAVLFGSLPPLNYLDLSISAPCVWPNGSPSPGNVR